MHTIKNESGLYLHNENTTMAGQVAGHSIDGFEPDGDVFLWTYDQMETLRLAESSDDFMAKCARSARDYYSWEWRWKLDTDTDGCDETLYGTREEVLANVLHYHDINELPSHWTLTRVE